MQAYFYNGTFGAHWSHVVADGRGVSAIGSAANGSKLDPVRDNAAGIGFAFWQTKGIRLVECSAIHQGFADFNFERTTGECGCVRPAADGTDATCRSLPIARANFRIIDPNLVHGVWTLSLPHRWYNTTNKRR